MSDSQSKKEMDLVDDSTLSPANVLDFLQTIVIALVIVIFLYLFVIIPNDVNGDSMRETLHNGELLLTYKTIQILGGPNSSLKNIFGDYKRGDIVVFHLDYNNEDLVKRVVGLPGDKVTIKGGFVYVNDQKLNETYLSDGSIDPTINNLGHTYTKDSDVMKEGEEITVPDGKYFVMGDNRENSLDSRFKQVGFVIRSQMKGKVFFRYLPLNRLGFVN